MGQCLFRLKNLCYLFKENHIIIYMFNRKVFFYLIFFSFFTFADDFEETVVTGSLIKNAENDLSPIQEIKERDLKNLTSQILVK